MNRLLGRYLYSERKADQVKKGDIITDDVQLDKSKPTRYPTATKIELCIELDQNRRPTHLIIHGQRKSPHELHVHASGNCFGQLLRAIYPSGALSRALVQCNLHSFTRLKRNYGSLNSVWPFRRRFRMKSGDRSILQSSQVEVVNYSIAPFSDGYFSQSVHQDQFRTSAKPM